MEFFSDRRYIFLFFSLSLSLLLVSNAQQPYIDNKQLDCYQDNNLNTTNGNVCNGPQTSCTSYLTFRSQPPNYDSATTIGSLLDALPSAIATINNITDIEKIPYNTPIIVPVNCPCTGGLFYQHNASYTLKTEQENYFTLANDTYEGLTTCQALIKQNRYDSRHLSKGMKLLVPLRCACPSGNQTTNGVKFLLAYLVTWGDDISQIATTFGVDQQSVLDANELSESDLIYPFTQILVPLKSEPTKIQVATSPPPPPPPPPIQVEGGSSKIRTGVFIGIGIGIGLFILAILGLLCFRRRRRQNKRQREHDRHLIPIADSAEHTMAKNARAVSFKCVRNLVDSLNEYTFEELQKATENFRDDHRIEGSVYQGVSRGDYAAIKRKTISEIGDVSTPTATEINILKMINHSSVIRLSGYCVNEEEGNVYLVYEFAENGSLSHWLHDKKRDNHLDWKQRVQIAYDVADGLNYLHNYTNPPYTHMDLKSSNILLNGDFRGKLTNFGLARTVEDEEDVDGGGGLHLTKHVMGTRGYMAPEYIENGLVTPKLDVFAFGVVMLELLSGKEAASAAGGGREVLLSASIKQVLQGDNVREKLRAFMDPSLESHYPLDSAFSMANLAMKCVAHDVISRPTMSDVFMSLSKMLSSSLDWDPSDELELSRSLSRSLESIGSGR